MRALRIEGATRRVAEDQDEYSALSIRDHVVTLPNGEKFPAITTSWEPDPGEVEHIRGGGALYVAFAKAGGGVEPALLRVPTPDEKAQLLGGGSTLVTIPGTVVQPMFVIVTTPEEAEACVPPKQALAVIAVRPVLEPVHA